MPLRQTKFSSAWLSSIDCNGQRLSEWCKKGKDDYHAFCCFCDMDIKCDNAGKAQLLQHCTKKKHQEAVKYSVDKRQSKLFVSTSKEQHQVQICLMVQCELSIMVMLALRQKFTGLQN